MKDKKSILSNFTEVDPVSIRGVVISLMAVVAAFGFALSNDKTEAIASAAVAIVALVQAFITRPHVTPNSQVVIYQPEPASNPSLIKPGPAVPGTTDENILKAAFSLPEQ